MANQEDDEYLIVIERLSGEEITRTTMNKEEVVELLRKISEGGSNLLAIPLLSIATGVPERTLRGAFDRNEIPYEYVGKKVRASTVDAVEHWKSNPEFHKRGRRKVSKKSD